MNKNILKTFSWAVVLVLPVPVSAKESVLLNEPMPVPNITRPPGYSPPAPQRLELDYEDRERLAYSASLESRVMMNWELGRLPLGSEPIVHFFIGRDGHFHDLSLVRSSGNQQADFSCLSAVAESSGFKIPPKNVEEVDIHFKAARNINTFDCASKFETALGGSENTIICHLIPLDVLQCIKGLDPLLVHSPANLRLIRTKDLNSQRIQALRNEWCQFLRANKTLTFDDVRKHAFDLEKKYGDLFLTKKERG